MMTSAQLDETFAALSNPLRREILARLVAGDATVNELSEPFDVSLPAISRHLKVLERAGLIKRKQDAQFRPCTINVEPLKEIASWTDQYRRIWDARFDQMETYMNNIKDNGRDD